MIRFQPIHFAVAPGKRQGAAHAVAQAVRATLPVALRVLPAAIAAGCAYALVTWPHSAHAQAVDPVTAALQAAAGVPIQPQPVAAAGAPTHMQPAAPALAPAVAPAPAMALEGMEPAVATPVPAVAPRAPAPVANARGVAPAAGAPRAAAPVYPPVAPGSPLPQRHVWDRTPVPVTLGVGPDRERRITFPAMSFVGIPGEIADRLRVQTVGNTSYFTALAPFPKTRVVVEDRASGNVILLDVTAQAGATANAPIEIHDPAAVAAATAASAPVKGARAAAAEAGEEEPEFAAPIDYVSFTRFAARQFYAPRRLATDLPGVRRVNVKTGEAAGLYAGAPVKAEVLAAWRSPDHYLTAVKLTNTSRSVAIEFDPRAIRGEWLAITAQHGRLLPAGDEADNTVVYLISDRAFEEAR